MTLFPLKDSPLNETVIVPLPPTVVPVAAIAEKPEAESGQEFCGPTAPITAAVFEPGRDGPPGTWVNELPNDPGVTVTTTGSDGVGNGTDKLIKVVEIPEVVDVLYGALTVIVGSLRDTAGVAPKLVPVICTAW